MAVTAEDKSDLGVVVYDVEDDEHDSKELVLQKYFLLEWKLVKSLLDDIVSNGRVSDPSSVHTIRSIVLLSLSLSHPILYYMCMCCNGLAMLHFGDSDFVIRLNLSAYPISSDCNVNWVLLIMAL